MSEPSSYDTFDSEEERNGWLMSSESSIDEDDDLSDELTLLNGDEDSDEDSLLDDDFIRLSQRLKEKYNLREATVELERCDKIWDTMQLVKSAQSGYESNDFNLDNEDGEFSSRSTSCVPEARNSFIPYIKYQPVQGNGNNALPNFYLAVKSQRRLYHCVTCGKQFSEKRGLRLHSEKDHGIIFPQERQRNVAEPKNLRPKTPSELGSRIARTSGVDDKISQNSSRRERDNSKSRLSNSSLDTNDTFKGRVKSTGLKEVDELLGLSYICPLCDFRFVDSKSLSRHSLKFHGITIAEAKKRVSTKSEIVPKRENLSSEESRRGARNTRTSREASSITEWLSSAAKTTNVKKEIPSNNNNSRSKGRTKRQKDYRSKVVTIINGFEYRYMLTCKSCGKTFFSKRSFKNHLKKIHGLTIPPFRSGGWKEASKNSGIFKYEMVKVDEMKRSHTSKNSQQVEKYAKSLIDRPRRACASRTSYTECSKAEEEALQKSLSVPMSPVKNPPNPPNQTTNCFLCKKSYVDIRKHLVDYHRINSPESVLPLTAKTEPEINEDCAESAKPIEIPAKPLEAKKPQEVKRPWLDLENNPNVEILPQEFKRFKCVICSYNYKYAEGIRRHLKNNTVNGVVQPHDPYTGQPRLSSHKKNKHRRQLELPLEDPIVDPLALTDASESSKTNSVCSEDVDYQSIKRKRTLSTSDERSSPNLESDAKRRKIEDFVKDNDKQNDAESRSDSAQENVERESVIELSETDRSSVEEVKSPNHRDTRDSSDRDSGIGISITIKKRNDSYEVVEKDNGGDDEKSSKDFENSKDDNLLLCSESSSDVAPVDYVNYVDDSRRNENVNSIDCSADENVLGSMMRNDNGDDVENEKKTEDRDTNNDEDSNYHWKEGCYNLEACTYMPGKVPPLKVLCRTALTSEELSLSESNNLKYSHQCPVCCRFYPTERDVTVHMLEHKVSRTNFRTARLHVIPSSALRRYGRRPV